MDYNILKSLPVKADLDNQVPYALYPSADNTNLTDKQYSRRLAQANSVNRGMAQMKMSSTNRILWGVGGVVILGGLVTVGCLYINGREKRKTEVEKGKQQRETDAAKSAAQQEVAKAKEAAKQETAKLRAELEKEKKMPRGIHCPTLDANGNEVEPDPIAKYIDELNAGKNKLCGIEHSNDCPLSQERLLGKLIRVGSIVGIGCDSGVGGSTFLMNLSLSAAKGEYANIIPNPNSQELSPMDVLYLSAEEMYSTFNERNPKGWLETIDYHDNVHFDNPYDCAREIYKRLWNGGKNKLIVLDGLGLMFTQRMKGDEVQILVNLLKLMMRDVAKEGHYWTCLYRIHSSKSGTDRKTQKRDTLAGSVNWDRMGNTTMILSYGEKPNERRLHPLKCRNAPNERNLTYILRLNEHPYLHYEHVRTDGLPQRKRWKKLCRIECEKIVTMYKDGMTIPQIVKKTGRDYNTIKKVLNLKE